MQTSQRVPQMQRIITAIAIVIALALPTGAQTQSKCTSLKYLIATKAAIMKARCISKALKTGQTVDGTCLANADTKLTARWAKAEARGDCIVTGEIGPIESSVDNFIDSPR